MMRISRVLAVSALAIVALGALLILTTVHADASPVPLFRSGFESPVTISTPYQSGTLWKADITGSDAQGFNWPAKIWNATAAYEFMLPQTTVSNISPVMNARIETVTGHDGAQTRALYQDLLTQAGGSQNDYYIADAKEPSVGGSMYLRYWLKLDQGLGNISVKPNWRSLFAFKTAGDFRIELYFLHDSTGKPYWYAHADNIANGYCGSNADPCYRQYWEISNQTVPVPAGKWALIEIYWTRDYASGNGRFYVASGGQTVFDYSGVMYGVNKSPINRIMPFIVYAGSAARPASQWVDDFEAWDSPPCLSLPCGASAPPVTCPACPPPPVCPAPPVPVPLVDCVTAGAVATCTARIQ